MLTYFYSLFQISSLDRTYRSAEPNEASVVRWWNPQPDQMPTGTTLIFVHILTILPTEMSPTNSQKPLTYTAEYANLETEW